MLPLHTCRCTQISIKIYFNARYPKVCWYKTLSGLKSFVSSNVILIAYQILFEVLKHGRSNCTLTFIQNHQGSHKNVINVIYVIKVILWYVIKNL